MMIRRVVHVCAIVFICQVSCETFGTVIADDGRIGIGAITGGNFGPGSFSIVPGRHTTVDDFENGNGEPVFLQNQKNKKIIKGPHDSATELYNSAGDYRGEQQYYLEKPHRPHGHEHKDGQGSSGSGQIIIGTVILPKTDDNRRNNAKHDDDALAGTLDSNGENNGALKSDNDFSSNGGQANVQIDSINGGNFDKEPGIDKKPDGAKEPNNNGQTGYPNENSGYPNDENEAVHSIGHGLNSNGGGNGGDSYNSDDGNSGYDNNSGSNEKEERWIWSSKKK